MEILNNSPLIRPQKLLFNIECNAKSVQVAGTNGKGSTCAFLASILMSYGLKVGIYTSPHIEDICERIRINNDNISYLDFERLVSKTNKMQNGMCKSDLMFYASVQYFNENNVDFAIFETGLGGTKDSATLIHHDYGILTHIDLDHTELLGDTLEKITIEKCGIIKNGMTIVSYTNKCKDIISQTCLNNGCKLVYSQDYLNEYDLSNLKMQGEHQKENALCSILCAKEILKEKFDKDIVTNAISNTFIFGRMSIIGNNPLVIADVSHNVDGIDKLCSYIDNINGKKLCIVSVVKTKDSTSMLLKLKNSFEEVWGIKIDNSCKDTTELNVDRSINLFDEIEYSKYDVIVYCGSFAIIRALKKYLKQK